MKRAGAEDDLARAMDLAAAALRDLDAGHFAALEDEALDPGFRHDGQVVALTGHRIEIADGGRDPSVVGVGEGNRGVALGEVLVHVGAVLVAGGGEGPGGGPGVAGPHLGEQAADRNAAFLAVLGTVEVHVPSQLLEVGQHRLPAPSAGAHRLPRVVIGGIAAQRHLAVDGGASAHDAALLVAAPGRRAGQVVTQWPQVDAEFGPVVVGAEVGAAGKAVEDVLGHPARRRVPARLDQENAVAAPRRKPVGQHASGRAAADDGVVDHGEADRVSQNTRAKTWGERGESNPRPPGPQPGALTN